MSAKVIDMAGQRFGRLLVLERAGLDKWGNAAWRCCCDCGKEKILGRCNLTSGNSQSCGCLNRELITKHGKSYTRLYRVWAMMKYNAKKNGFGICAEWNSFQAFHEWAMSHGFQEDAPKGESFVYRIDTKKGYSPENCAVGSARQACKRKGERRANGYA